MSRRELGGSTHRGATRTPPHRALRNEGGWTIPTRVRRAGGAAPRVVGAQVAAAVHRHQKDRQDRVPRGSEKDGKMPSLYGWEGVARKRAVTRIIAMEAAMAVFELRIGH